MKSPAAKVKCTYLQFVVIEYLLIFQKLVDNEEDLEIGMKDLIALIEWKRTMNTKIVVREEVEHLEIQTEMFHQGGKDR